MALAELNVRLGLIYKDLDRGLKNVERSLERSGRRLSSLGNELTIAVSAPLAALGISAIQQAGNLESLKLAMKSTFETAGRSATDAEKEVEALRKSALAPGLDFEQAIQGSIRLQGVGYAAEEARATLEQVANAIALTGGTAQNLDSVTVQFSQMIAKGKVLSQDLRIIQDNMPIISRLMQDAFGTQNAEQLQAMGISGREFVDRITAAAKVLPRVEGGIKNAIVNAGAAARIALAELGTELNKAFNITGLLDRFAKGLQGVVDWFKALSLREKEALINTVLFAAALGPMLKAFAAIQALRGALLGFFAEIVSITKSMAAGMIRLVAAANTMSVAMRALTAVGIAGLIIGIVAALHAMGAFQRELTAAEKAQASVNSVMRQASQDISDQRVKVAELVRVIQDENKSREEQEAALNALKAIAPEHFKNLDIEKAKTGQLKQSVDAYIDSMLRAARAKRAFARLEELDKLRGRIAEVAEPSMWENVVTGIENVAKGGSAFDLAQRMAAKYAENLGKLTAEWDEEEKQLRSVIEANGGVVAAMGESAAAVGAFGTAAKTAGTAAEGASKKAEMYRDALASINAVVQKGDVLGSNTITEQAKEIETQIERLLENGFKPYGKEIQHLRGMLKALHDEARKGFAIPNATQQEVGFSGPTVPTLPTLPTPGSVFSIDVQVKGAEEIKALTEAATRGTEAASQYKSQWESIAGIMVGLSEGTASFSSSISDALLILNEHGRGLEATFLSAAAAMGDAFATAEGGFGQMALAAVAAGAKIIQVTIQEGVARAVASALQSVPFPFNLALGALAGGLAAGLFSKAIGAIGLPALAQGGVVNKPTMALIGEYPGAANNPEIVTPENKLRSIFQESAGGQGELVARVSGNDLLFIVDYAAKRRGRVR